jgi:dienelactone hydrolase
MTDYMKYIESPGKTTSKAPLVVLGSIVVVLLFGPFPGAAQEHEDLKLFSNWMEWSDGNWMLMHYLNRQAFRLLDRRDSAVAKLVTKNDWERRQRLARSALMKDMGSFPAKTPLNAKTTGTVQMDGFHLEKVVFQSTPGFYVTGCLCIPDGVKKKRPAVIYVSGHEDLGYRYPGYQRMMYNLARQGFVVLGIDPIGEGERRQYVGTKQADTTIRWWSTKEHTYAAIQCFLAGESIAKYFIWDGIRAIDYLQTRPEVDAGRIGITGRSGGGTLSAYIAAFDKRVKACATENYVTSERRLLQSRGPQDGEQNFYHWLSDGTSLEDLLIMMMPRPTLLVATTRDIFSIQGTREVYQRVARGYAAFHKREDFKMVEDHAAHASTKKNNDAIYRFFHHYLSLPEGSLEGETAAIAPEKLYDTKTGQVTVSLGSKTVFDLNKAVCEKLYGKMLKGRSEDKSHLLHVKQRSAELSGYRDPQAPADIVYRGSYQRDGYTVGMYALVTVQGYVIPVLVARPDSGGKHRAVIYIHPGGKEEGIAPGGRIEKMVKRGFIVAAPDLLGMGETKPVLRFPAEASLECILIGRRLVGIQAADIVSVERFVKHLPDVQGNVSAIAFGEECPALLHAAVYDTSLSSIALVKAPVSYFNIVQTRLYTNDPSFTWGVAGALTAYDLPDLAACVAPRKLTFLDMMNANGEPASSDVIRGQMSYPEQVYKNSAADNLKIVTASGVRSADIIDWLEGQK